MKASLFYLPTVGNRAQIEAGLAGMREDLDASAAASFLISLFRVGLL